MVVAPPSEEAQRVGPRVAPTVAPEQPRVAPKTPSVVGVAATEPGVRVEPDVGSLAAQQAHAVEAKRPLVEVIGLAPSDLQKAFIFSEIFSPPLALREQQSLF